MKIPELINLLMKISETHEDLEVEHLVYIDPSDQRKHYHLPINVFTINEKDKKVILG